MRRRASSSAARPSISRQSSGGKTITISTAEFAELIGAGKIAENCDLSVIEWQELPEGRVHVRGCQVRNGSFADAALDGALFESTTFFACSFRSAQMTGARFVGCSFFDAEERKGCNFAGAELVDAAFVQCNLSLSKFGHANLHNASFKACKASGADFEGANFARRMGRQLIAGGTLADCMLDMASFAGLILDNCDFGSSSLRNADFTRSNLAETRFRGCDLSDTVFTGATMDKADIREAKLANFDLKKLKSYADIRVSRSQLGVLVGPLGLRVFAD